MRKLRIALLGLGLLAISAHADAPTTAYKTALKQGRALEDKGDYQGAMTIFTAALAAKPDDHGVMASEMSAVAYQLKQYDRAAEMAAQAAVAGNSPTLEAIAKFNLARAFEAQAMKPQAIAAYVESLSFRNRKTVRDRLAALDPQKAFELDPFALHPMNGPLPTLSTFCAGLQAAAKQDYGAGEADSTTSDDDANDAATVTTDMHNCVRLEPEKDQLTRAIGPKGSAISEARVVTFETTTETRTGKYFSQEDLYVIVKTARGWWTAEALTASSTDHCEDIDETVRDLSITGNRLVIRYDSETIHHCGGTSGSVSSNIALIGVGPSGVPQLMRPIVYAAIQNDGASWGTGDVDDKVTDRQALTIKVTPDGLEFKAKTGKDLIDLVGKHVLAFP